MMPSSVGNNLVRWRVAGVSVPVHSLVAVRSWPDPSKTRYQVSRVFDLRQAKAAFNAKALEDRAERTGSPAEPVMQVACVAAVSKLLCHFEISNGDKGIVSESVLDTGFIYSSRQSVVAVEVELQTQWAPSRHAYVAKSVLRIDEMEVVVQALACVGTQKRLVCHLVMPGR